jgi:DNA invertase Pin-like site-specific DNA recombinase
MKNEPPAPKPFRCAIYTRKSTEHNLDLEFNSLDAQREACEAYIKSQAHEGWRAVPDHYDDGGLSGASLDRPALQTLLADIRARKIDIVVVYKVDRLTRALGDFAKLVEVFDEQSVSFVSVTQSFNTTSSMGRLTLNMLLSFAQFEREVIGERVRDKIAASKKKGIWVGGSVPLGYASIDKKLVIVPEDAEKVRTIFRRYLEVGSITALAQDLQRQGIRTRRQPLSNGKIRGDIPFGVGALHQLLKNRFLIGEVVYGGEVYGGEHDPILDRTLFSAVQAKLEAQAVARQNRLRGSPAILMGRIFDEKGNQMSPTHSNKGGVRYRYYVSHAVVEGQKTKRGAVARLPAPELETMVTSALRQQMQQEGINAQSAANENRELIERYIDRVIVHPDTIEVRLNNTARTDGPSVVDQGLTRDSEPSVLVLPWTASGAAKGVLHASPERTAMSLDTRAALLAAIAKARAWIQDLVAGRVASLAEIASRESKVERHVRLLAPLAFVPPPLIKAIVEGSAGSDLTITSLAKRLPFLWGQDVGQES